MPRRKTNEEFISEVFELFQNEYTVLGEYTNNREKILIKHNPCGNTFLKIPKDMVVKKSGCPYCCGNKSKLYSEEWVIDNIKEPYKYIKGYIGMAKKCTFYCETCKTEFQQTPRRLIIEGVYGCNCCPTRKKTHKEFIGELGEEYTALESYVNADTKILIKHNPCGCQFKISPYSLLKKHLKKYCPVCYYKKSKGEILIASALLKLNILFEREYCFPNLQNRKFDFFIPSLSTCIEFDGKQHSEVIEFFGGQEDFESRKLRDKEKNQFCLTNNLSLYRITYKDIEDIDKIIINLFKEKSSETIEKYLVTDI